MARAWFKLAPQRQPIAIPLDNLVGVIRAIVVDDDEFPVQWSVTAPVESRRIVAASIPVLIGMLGAADMRDPIPVSSA
jgi:hypothetical protein